MGGYYDQLLDIVDTVLNSQREPSQGEIVKPVADGSIDLAQSFNDLGKVCQEESD